MGDVWKRFKQAKGILVVPFWACQSWYPKLMRLLVASPLVISHRQTLLTLPVCQKLHPLRKKFNMLACQLCGDSTKTEAFLRKQPTLSYNPGASHHRSSIRKWLLVCIKRQADPICPSITIAVEFLTTLYEEGLSYSSIKLRKMCSVCYFGHS